VARSGRWFVGAADPRAVDAAVRGY
jgi:hypothetical protein